MQVEERKTDVNRARSLVCNKSNQTDKHLVRLTKEETTHSLSLLKMRVGMEHKTRDQKSNTH